MTATAVWVDYPPILDKSYRQTRLGRHIVDWLADMDLDEMAERYIDDCERTLSYVAKTWPNVELADLDDTHIAHALRLKPRPTRRKMRYHLSAFFKWAVRKRRIDRNPVDLLGKMRAPKRKHRDVFTDPEVDDLYALPALDAGLMGLLFGAGLRKSECLPLQVRRVTVEPPPHVTVIEAKGGKYRRVLLDEVAAQLVRELLLFERLDAQDHFWYRRPGGGVRVHRDRAISDVAFDAWWARSLAKAGVRYRNPHMARHTYATRWLRDRGRLETLSGQMGHESIRTTYDLYAHLDDRDALQDLAVIEAARREAKGDA